MEENKQSINSLDDEIFGQLLNDIGSTPKANASNNRMKMSFGESSAISEKQYFYRSSTEY